MESVLYESLRTVIPHVLERYDVRPGDLAELENFAADDSILLTGSQARGEATATSDLDLTVICAAPPARRPGVRGYPSVFGDSVVAGQLNGLIVNVDYLRRDILRAVCDALASSAGPSSSSIANLGDLELRALERAGSGIVLRLAAGDADLVARADVQRARANTAAIAFIEGRSNLRAVEGGDLDPVSRALRLHAAAEYLLIAEVNALGSLTYNVKHLASRVRKLAGPAYLELLDALAAASGATTSSRPDVLASARAAMEVFLADLSADPDRALVRRMLRPVVNLPAKLDNRQG
ncbi:MAG TPA: nucleotidyltransferase domain-containing protein [Streptosporangiaceae bacterium]|nr:nucleotidyltransferase domain-containing protein [Streptosporangiaceae bacterium]